MFYTNADLKGGKQSAAPVHLMMSQRNAWETVYLQTSNTGTHVVFVRGVQNLFHFSRKQIFIISETVTH